ncbi:hypothetical protein J6590_009878 [Homalodisca vitripennis]|nr:hypothetical protein J6590_009878 [Homalodisca vitripennis]
MDSFITASSEGDTSPPPTHKPQPRQGERKRQEIHIVTLPTREASITAVCTTWRMFVTHTPPQPHPHPPPTPAAAPAPLTNRCCSKAITERKSHKTMGNPRVNSLGVVFDREKVTVMQKGTSFLSIYLIRIVPGHTQDWPIVLVMKSLIKQ